MIHFINSALRIMIVFIGILFVSSTCWATTYYVDARAKSNDNTGTSPETAFRTIQKAAGVMTAGDDCLVQTGTYDETVYMSTPGNSGSPIVFQADGAVSLQGWSVSGDYVHIIGFEVTGGRGIELKQASHCLVQDNHVHDVSFVGIDLQTSPSYRDNDTCVNNIVRGNTIVRANRAGIRTMGQDHLIENNDISEIYPDGDGIRFFGQNITFRGNYIHDLYHPIGSDPHVDFFQTWMYAHDIVFEGNRCHSTETSKSNQIFMVEEQEGTVGNFIIRNNIFIMSDPGYCPLNIHQKVDGKTIDNITIINNTFIHRNVIGKGDEAIRLTRVNGAIIKNNIFYNWGSKYKDLINLYLVENSNIDIGYNNVFVTDGNYPSDGPYPNDIWGQNPNFVDWSAHDYHLLKAKSPAIDAGYNSGLTKDFDGTMRPQNGIYDIGAYESTSSSAPSPPSKLRII